MATAPSTPAAPSPTAGAAAIPPRAETRAATSGAPAEARRVSIADRVARAFSPLACVRGYRYFERRKVTLSNVTERGVDADVKGKRTQRVRLRVDGGQLAAACSCAAKALGPAACRHLWATLLEIDRQGALGDLRRTSRTLALSALDAPRPKRARAAKAKPAAFDAGGDARQAQSASPAYAASAGASPPRARTRPARVRRDARPGA